MMVSPETSPMSAATFPRSDGLRSQTPFPFCRQNTGTRHTWPHRGEACSCCVSGLTLALLGQRAVTAQDK